MSTQTTDREEGFYWVRVKGPDCRGDWFPAFWEPKLQGFFDPMENCWDPEKIEINEHAISLSDEEWS